MTAFHDFIRAAASYYGLPAEQLTEGCTIDTTNGDIEVVLRIAMTGPDVEGVAKRMAIMRREAEVDEALAKRAAEAQAATAPTIDQMRAEFNALVAHARSAYGSFARYAAARRANAQRDAVSAGLVPGGPDNTTPEPVAMPKYVWIHGDHLTESQKAGCIGLSVERGEYALDPDELTEDQRTKARTP